MARKRGEKLTSIYEGMSRPDEQTRFTTFQFSKDENGKWWIRHKMVGDVAWPRWEELYEYTYLMCVAEEHADHIIVKCYGPCAGVVRVDLYEYGRARLPVNDHGPTHPNERW